MSGGGQQNILHSSFPSSSLSMETLNDLFEKSLSSFPADVKNADLQLNVASRHVDFLNIIFKLILHDGVDINVRLAASIYLKNYIKRNWYIQNNEEKAGGGGGGESGGINETNRKIIKNNLLEVIIRVNTPKNIYAQILESLNIIAEVDFPIDWEDLLSYILNNFLNNTNTKIQVIGLEITENILQKYAKCMRSTQILQEMKIILGVIQNIILDYFKYLIEKIKFFYQSEGVCGGRGVGGGEEIYTLMYALLLICKIFYSLNVIDIPEFFEDNIQVFFEGFCFILKIHFVVLENSSNANYSIVDINSAGQSNLNSTANNNHHFPPHKKLDGATADDDDTPPGIEEQVKVQICENMTLYCDKYQEEFVPVVTMCILAATDLLQNLDMSVRNDDLFCSATKFLSSASKTDWMFSDFNLNTSNNNNTHHHIDFANLFTFNFNNLSENNYRHFNPFKNNQFIKLICDVVILKNLQLRLPDIRMLEEDAEEYIRRNMDGGERESRRAAAFNLVKSLNKLHSSYTREVLMSWITNITNEASCLQDEKCKEMLCYLVTSLSIKCSTSRAGVTEIYDDINFYNFYLNNLKSELCEDTNVNHKILVRSAALKFIENFRNFFPLGEVPVILNILLMHLRSKSAVLHTYAANCLEKILLLKDKNKMPKVDAAQNAHVLLQCMNQVRYLLMGNSDIQRNEYLAKCLMRLLCVLKHHSRESSMMVLQEMMSIIKANSVNPSNALFVHFIFESTAVIVKLYAPTHTNEIERIMLPVVSVIVEQGVHDFLPYCLQILGILIHSGTPNPQVYIPFFEHLLNNNLWTASNANVPGIISLFAAFFEKHQIFEELITKNMERILEKLQYCLYHRKLLNSSFELLNNIFYFLPFKIYMQYFQTLVTVLLKKLHEKKDEFLSTNILVSFLIFTCRNTGELLPRAFNAIQPGLNDNVGKNVLVPAAKKISGLQNRRICAWGFSKLLCSPEYGSNADLYKESLKVISQLITGFEEFDKNRPEVNAEENLDMYDTNEPEYEISFNKLKAASPPSKADFFKNADMLGGIRANVREQAENIQRIVAEEKDPQVQNVLSLLRL